MTTHHDLGYRFTADSGGFTYDIVPPYTNWDGGFGPQDDFYFYLFLDHGDVMDLTVHYRIHQPTTNLNNNTEAILDFTPFSTVLDGTVAPDHGDKNGDLAGQIINSGPNNENGAYLPGRWMKFELYSFFGSTEFTFAYTRSHFNDGTGYINVSQGPGRRTRPQNGGWNAGHA